MAPASASDILLPGHVHLGAWQVFPPPATEPGYIRTAGGGNPAVLIGGTPLEGIWLFPGGSGSPGLC